MNSKLPPLDFDELTHKWDGVSEEKEVEFQRCTHKETKIEEGELICMHCPARWTGPRLAELQSLLKQRS